LASVSFFLTVSVNPAAIGCLFSGFPYFYFLFLAGFSFFGGLAFFTFGFFAGFGFLGGLGFLTLAFFGAFCFFRPPKRGFFFSVF
jgi:hypothetical protein